MLHLLRHHNGVDKDTHFGAKLSRFTKIQPHLGRFTNYPFRISIITQARFHRDISTTATLILPSPLQIAIATERDVQSKTLLDGR